MVFPQSIRISQKIMLLVAGLALGFVAIGIAYFVQMTTEQAIRQQREQVAENTALLSSARVDVIELNRLLMEFVAFRNVGLLSRSTAIKNNLLDKLELLNTRGKEIGISADINEIGRLAQDYGERYQKSVEQLQILGGDKSGGLKQKLTDAGESFERLLSEISSVETFSIYISMRRLENRFFIDPTTETLAEVERQLDMLAAALGASNIPSALKPKVDESIDLYRQVLAEVAEPAKQVRNLESQLQALGEELTESMTLAASHLQEYAQKITSETEYKSQFALALFVGLSFAVVMAMAVGVFLIYKSIVFPMAHIQNVIRRINRGNLKARVRLLQEDELGDLGRAFNILLDERIQTLEEQSLENEQLNNSIISLIRALGAIAQKNLTIKVPVSADITGTISDAVNLLTSETAKTLGQVRDISEKVNHISDLLQLQSTSVLRVAEDERKQVMATSKALDLAARAMNEIASRAQTADAIASKTIADTQLAREAVMKSVSGILTIRETISETEKRIKRLGDRSQEISGIVNLINTIAERTHILALNASMHAASAGEAGKGFAVVADEVQRLAENAREATAEISAMVNNIRVETSDTVNIMNKLITDVAEGTRLAEQAGRRMEVTEDATRQLVETVQAISHSSIHQAQISNKIRDRANIIRNFTEKTGGELVQQKRHTDSLKHYAEVLLERVNIFALPENLERYVGIEGAVDEVELIKNAS